MVSRRSFLSTVGAAGVLSRTGRAQDLTATGNLPVEWSLRSSTTYSDPFNQLEVDAIITDPNGREQRVPAFWSGENVWRVRYAASAPGRYRWRAAASVADRDLNAQSGTIQVEQCTGQHPLHRHGPLRISANRRYLEHADGTPFFWLGDTWWLGLTKRLSWPGDFRRLVEDRVAKNFTVVQFVAGLFPDMDSFDPRGMNEAGFPWEKDYARINPRFFDMADLRVQFMVDRGLTPCVLGCWGYYLPKIGARKMSQHWRNLIARWGAYPVVWCLAGETSMPWYLSNRKDQEREELKKGWTEIGRYVRRIDPYKRIVTAHPSRTARESVEDPSILDFDMLQTGHSDRRSIPNTIKVLNAQLAAEPKMPVLNGEVTYEGILEASREEIQRFMFWSCMLSGAAGHTYGANGIWQVNREGDPYGPSPHGRSWGNVPWTRAMELPGSAQTGYSAALLRKYEWWRFEPHPEWVEPRWTEANYEGPYAAGIPGSVRMIYLPAPGGQQLKVKSLEPGVRYRSRLFDPISGELRDWASVEPSNGEWAAPSPGVMQDWVVILERMS
jgi:hypothetical protein